MTAAIRKEFLVADKGRTTKIGRLLQSIVSESDAVRLLRDNPEQLAAKFGLDERDLRALRAADSLVITLRGREITFETGSTFTANLRGEVTFETGTTITARRPQEMTFETGSTITARGS
jgi:hypothetical protein